MFGSDATPVWSHIVSPFGPALLPPTPIQAAAWPACTDGARVAAIVARTPLDDAGRLEARVRVARPTRSLPSRTPSVPAAALVANGAVHVTATVTRAVARNAAACLHRSLDRRPWIEGSSLDLAIGARAGGSIHRMARVEERRERRRPRAPGARATRRAPLREGEVFTSISGAEVEPLATPETARVDYERDLGYPGSFPFTRGVYPSMYRGRLWTMRQFAGFGTAEETNERFRYLLDHGQTGLSCAFDMPALMGVDSDSPRALGEVGREGVAMASLEDMRVLFAGIPLGEVSTSMTINSSAAIALAMYLVVGEEQGVPRDRLRGTIQTDILKEYIAQKEFIFPPGPSMRLVTDMVEFCAARDAALASDLDLRLPHPRGGLDGGAGARVHAEERVHVRGVGARARARRRRVRAAAVVLLQRAPRLLRGDREVPGGPADLGARDARHATAPGTSARC